LCPNCGPARPPFQFGLTKDFATAIIISEATYQMVKHAFSARYLGEVTVKGKEIPVKIFAVDRPLET